MQTRIYRPQNVTALFSDLRSGLVLLNEPNLRCKAWIGCASTWDFEHRLGRIWMGDGKDFCTVLPVNGFRMTLTILGLGSVVWHFTQLLHLFALRLCGIGTHCYAVVAIVRCSTPLCRAGSKMREPDTLRLSEMQHFHNYRYLESWATRQQIFTSPPPCSCSSISLWLPNMASI